MPPRYPDALLFLPLQVRKLEEERTALHKRLAGAERRDRLAELCRRQVRMPPSYPPPPAHPLQRPALFKGPSACSHHYMHPLLEPHSLAAL